jgi:hypothetical protein
MNTLVLLAGLGIIGYALGRIYSLGAFHKK